jgi:hypothetical protein
VAPEPVALRDPCDPRALPSTGGLTGFVQDRALEYLDTSACDLGATREELLLAMFDPADRARFEARHGKDPRDVLGPLRAFLG